MKNDFVRQAISPDLRVEINSMIEKLKNAFGLELSIIQASKVVAWKSKSYNIQINEKRLIEILGNKTNVNKTS